MAGTSKGKRRFCKRLLFGAIIPGIILLAAPLTANAQSEDEKAVEQRVIKIEGSVDKPRIIFIVPRARLVKLVPGINGQPREITEPAYPAVDKDTKKR